MKTLALDTTTPIGSIVISEDDNILVSLSSDVTMSYSEKLHPMLMQALQDADLEAKDIDLFVVTNGPGSFTGIRIGLSSIKGMALANNKSIIALSSLEALACSYPGYKRLVTVYNALRGNVYAALFNTEEKYPKRLCEDMLISKNELHKKLNEDDFLVGNGTELFKDTKLKLDKTIMSPEAEKFIRLGTYYYYKKINLFDCYSLKPVYLQAAAAEEKKKGIKDEII